MKESKKIKEKAIKNEAQNELKQCDFICTIERLDSKMDLIANKLLDIEEKQEA